jgi:hypothetical protein
MTHERYQCLTFRASPNLPRTNNVRYGRNCAWSVPSSAHTLHVSRIGFGRSATADGPHANAGPSGGGTGMLSSGQALL